MHFSAKSLELAAIKDRTEGFNMKKLATFILCAALSVGAFAQKTVEQTIRDAQDTDFSYTWVEVNYVDLDSDLDGLRVKGSLEITEPISVIGSIGLYSEGRVDVTSFSGGASYHLNVGSLTGVGELNKLDAVVFAEIQYLEVEVGSVNDDEMGIRTGAEARYQALEMLEAYIEISYSTVDTRVNGNGYGNDFSFGTGVRYAPVDFLQLTAGLTFADDDELYLGARFNF